jgi:hypothetical protein
MSTELSRDVTKVSSGRGMVRKVVGPRGKHDAAPGCGGAPGGITPDAATERVGLNHNFQ